MKTEQPSLWAGLVTEVKPYDCDRDMLAEYGERPNVEAASDEVQS